MKIQWQMSSLKNSLRYIMIIGCYDMTFILMTTCKSVNAWELFFGAKKKTACDSPLHSHSTLYTVSTN